MAKRTDYSKVSLKSKPKSIRYNIKDFEAACGLCGRSTVQGLWDYLMAKYLSDMGVRQIAPIGKIDTRPVDERVFDVSKERVVVDEMSLYKKDVSHYMPRFENLPAPKVNFSPITEKAYDGSDIDRTKMDEMPMWKPKPKPEKVITKAEIEKSAAAELKKLKDIQEWAEKRKGIKKK